MLPIQAIKKTFSTKRTEEKSKEERLKVKEEQMKEKGNRPRAGVYRLVLSGAGFICMTGACCRN